MLKVFGFNTGLQPAGELALDMIELA